MRGAGAGRDREAAAAGPGGGPAGLGLREAAPALSERGVRRAGAAAARWEPAGNPLLSSSPSVLGELNLTLPCL